MEEYGFEASLISSTVSIQDSERDPSLFLGDSQRNSNLKDASGRALMETGFSEQWILSLPCDSEDLETEMWKMLWDLHQGLWMCLNFSILYLGPSVHTIHPQEYTSRSPEKLTGDAFLSFYFHLLLALFLTRDFTVKQEPSQLTSALWCQRAHTESSIWGVGYSTE